MVADIFSGLCSPNYFSDVTILALTLKKNAKSVVVILDKYSTFVQI